MLHGTGVIPFIAFSPAVAGALPLPADLVQNAALLQLGYGASIASFLGGVHWGMAMGEYGGLPFPTWVFILLPQGVWCLHAQHIMAFGSAV